MELELESPLESRVLLPAARTGGGQPLMVALGLRHSSREYDSREVPAQLLSDLLWAASGVNRADGGRTAPSARNWREIAIYVVKADGLFRYEPDDHSLLQVSARDVRASTGLQDFVGSAPLNLVYVADLAKVGDIDPLERRFFCAANAGFIAQNVYLFCASEGLATVVRGMVNRRELALTMQLRAQQRVLLAQTVGYAAPGP